MPQPTNNLEITKFQVTATLAQRVYSRYYNPPTLDGVLAYAVVQTATQGHGLPDTIQPYYIPLPLEKLWTCPRTFAPLWNVTQFFPIGENTQQTVYWHKRGFRPELLEPSKQGKPANPRFTQGPHKEYRIPIPQQSCKKWRAYGAGDLNAVMQLLKGVGSFGKKHTQGHGVIACWEVAQIDDFAYHHDGRLIKAFPVAFPELSDTIQLQPGVALSRYPTAWTPPYWKETLFQECIF